MNFGNTIEEQYAKITTINKIVSKFSKVFSVILLIVEAGMAFVLISLNEGNKSMFAILLLGIFLAASGFFIGKYFLGRLCGWAWILFCEKHNPKGLAKHVSNAAHNTAVEGFVWGGTSGAKATSVGFLIGILLFINVYIWKGTFYMIKYWNLPQKESQLKKQLDAKYGKTV